MLITYAAYSQELPDAAVSALSLEKMVPKRDTDGLNLNVRAENPIYFFYRLTLQTQTILAGSKSTRLKPTKTRLPKRVCVQMQKTYTASLRT
jgi:hypothetical protein